MGFPNRQGFDYSFGYFSQSHAHNYYPEYLFRNGEKVFLRNFVPVPKPNGAGEASVKVDYSHDRITDEALAWLKQHHRKPFCLYLALTLPHANNEAGPRGQEVPGFGPYADRDWPDSQKGTASMISRLDRTVGQVRGLLRQLGVAENTLVVFSSDNGPHAEGGTTRRSSIRRARCVASSVTCTRAASACRRWPRGRGGSPPVGRATR